MSFSVYKRLSSHDKDGGIMLTVKGSVPMIKETIKIF